MRFIDGFRESIAFLTILPAGAKDGDWKIVADYMWFFPIVGLILGGLAGIIGSLSLQIFPPSISAALSLFFLLFLCGFHHLDGLLDFGDALMFRGTIEDRRAVMKDVNTGVGGFGLGFFFLLIAFLSIYEFILKGGSLFLILISSEVLAKFSMVLASYFGRSYHDGMGSMFTDAMNKNHGKLFLSLILSFIVLYFFLQYNAIILVIGAFASCLILVQVSNLLLDGVSGDTFGAINEITRTVIMLMLVVL